MHHRRTRRWQESRPSPGRCRWPVQGRSLPAGPDDPVPDLRGADPQRPGLHRGPPDPREAPQQGARSPGDRGGRSRRAGLPDLRRGMQ
ncbi:MAG: hypothetical protein UU40_C0001G0033 [Candidatus Uhrbacteria bacterium GW2011_GWD2_41_121]|uniref:Uncharacterized protein n=1 Tax=Candidatus Uhrbacteria bacterium GW2011_GWC1_41_20 TaxID=1618983 RepID=A0A0G0VG81_9BACT|nr:MAG: hypothetical protein UT52_C0001G0037 [Candidatus Uhrbacteria bacterium GW2011_GWE1_39_46]KKR64426.1 MAG: hypothetical protein UU04_C0002G0037 [Candidatus Uhrbacteria bacterium GW2011_GWC2_40_450]KKR90695.1 MAG: hypothetical protein UU40_C0001G0033 [Candidatus Uhrbacteria bacterium GW2011_GWD2_41_121]KKR96588.1 MAG: hypothetical protein UU46_C0001G0037 [Candidatus Uhrbacteria bacterium GW2011_GWD1_41_16]KKR99979.1 MAG: hypothetical protein UU50_C0001G0037 [Candidatus Uhrbacteria bacteriu